MTTRVLPLIAAAALAVSGCGDDASKEVDVKQIRSVVQQFADADGPKACRLMSPDGLVNVYGGFSAPVAQARANCLRKSASFKGRPVRLTVLKVIDPQTVRQGALSQDGKITYNVTLRKFGPAWRVDEITQVKTR
jgi:hypothetical protein